MLESILAHAVMKGVIKLSAAYVKRLLSTKSMVGLYNMDSSALRNPNPSSMTILGRIVII